MLLRPRQKIFVDRSISSLENFGNTLGVAPTGAGKTILFSHIVGNLIKGGGLNKVLVIAHRDELTEQNRDKFLRIHPKIASTVVDAKTKSWDGNVTFAMVQTLSMPENLENMPSVDLLVIDEAHHAAAETYRRIVDRALELNPDCKILGLTATPNRSDGKGLREVFSNVADQISLAELVSSGHLVMPRTFVIDVGVRGELSRVKVSGSDFDMAAVDRIMNQEPINEAVVEQWKEKAEKRKTVVFCSTIAHAESVTAAFSAQGVRAVMVSGQMTPKERNRNLVAYSEGDASVIVNVQVLTEGWDHPPTSCVVLLRPSSAKSTMIQMVGRGLRTINAQEHPDLVKHNCIVLDFGTSSLIHGTLEQDIDLDGMLATAEPLMMDCPSCGSQIPLASYECPICGEELRSERQKTEKELVTSVEMMEINLLARSSFEWVELFDDHSAFLSTGFNAWAGVFKYSDDWYSVAGREKDAARVLTVGERVVCLAAADDWLNENETEETAYKTRKWLSEQPTERQISILPKNSKLDFNLTRYQASAHITFQANKNEIVNSITSS
jgi:DNA repair protein RadD